MWKDISGWSSALDLSTHTDRNLIQFRPELLIRIKLAYGIFAELLRMRIILGSSWLELQLTLVSVWYESACYEDTLEDFVIYEVTKLMDMGVQEKE